MIKGCKEKFFYFIGGVLLLLVNKKLLLAAFYHLTYQHDSKDFNICNYKQLGIHYRPAVIVPALTE